MPSKRAVDEVSGIDGGALHGTAPMALLDEEEPIHGQMGAWASDRLVRVSWRVSAMALAGMTSASCATGSSLTNAPFEAVCSGAVLTREAERQRRMSARLSNDQRFGE